MGLERTLAVIQGKPSPYETQLFARLIDRICRLSKKEYGRDGGTDRAIRVVAEHSRGIAFLIADGVVLSNEGRGYVLRRILRRASVFGRKLGLNDPFLNEMVDVVLSTMSHIYPELAANQGLINGVVKAEEEKFIATLDTGLNFVERLVGVALTQKREQLTGEEVFRRRAKGIGVGRTLRGTDGVRARQPRTAELPHITARKDESQTKITRSRFWCPPYKCGSA